MQKEYCLQTPVSPFHAEAHRRCIKLLHSFAVLGLELLQLDVIRNSKAHEAVKHPSTKHHEKSPIKHYTTPQ
jgi:hypothetical protein